MKKLVLTLAVVFSMSFFACGNKEQAAEATEEAPVATEEVVAAVEENVDTLTNDTTVAAAVEAVEAPAEGAAE